MKSIIVKNPPPQEIFEKVCRHLFKQGERSVGMYMMSNGKEWFTCKYRSKNEQTGQVRKCSIGILIPDSHYRIGMDSNPAGNIVSALVKGARRFGWKLPAYFEANELFLQDLQNIHDRIHHWKSTTALRRACKDVAKDYGLDTKFLKDLKLPS